MQAASSLKAKIVVGLGVLILLAIPLTGSQYLLTILVLAGVYALACVGINLFMGYTGQVSFGHNAFAAIGGYLSALLTTRLGWPPLAALALGAVVSFYVAWIVGYPTLRLRGHYLAIATFALGQITYVLSVQLESITNGYIGIASIPPMGVGTWVLRNVTDYYYVLWFLVALGVWLSNRIVDSRIGRALRAINGNEAAARSLGVNATHYKTLALAVSAAYVSVAASMFAHFVSYISPEAFGLPMVLLFFTILFVGGLGTRLGPVIGAIIIVSLPEILRDFKDYAQLVYSGLLLIILVLAPRGVYSVVEWAAPLRRWWLRKQSEGVS